MTTSLPPYPYLFTAAAAAANLPGMQKLDLGANDFVEMSIQKKKEELRAYEDSEQKVLSLNYCYEYHHHHHHPEHLLFLFFF